jgi:DNA-binding Xre family transcriptional regulator
MGASKRIKQIMIERDINVKELAENLDFVGSSQALSNKLYKDNFSFADIEKIATALNCDIKIVDRKTGKEF